MTNYEALNHKISISLEQASQREALLSAVARGRDARAQTLQDIPGGEAFRERVSQIKQRCIEDLPELIARFTQNARARGATVYLAREAREACDYVLNLARERNVSRITKSKSLTTEEIELNHPLEKAGIEVLETDLGELIIQMAGELPYHLVFPAVHKTAEQVAELFRGRTGEPVSSDLGEIMALMRRYLRPKFLQADMGITGANVAIAETGSLLIETNEGNGRLVSAIPRLHVAVVGIEKIVSTIDQALQLIFAHPVSATGQLLTTYVSFFAGRSPLNAEKDRELHIVLLDNGRLLMSSDDGFREALHCIRCGACMNICPTYGVLGGHIFGHIYPGPIGIPWTAQVHGLEQAAAFTDLCISCGLCKEICPANIDIPWMIARVKENVLEHASQPLVNRVLMASESLAKFACATAPVSNWLLRSRVVKALTEKVLGLDRRRKLPEFARTTLRKRFVRRAKRARASVRKVAFFADYAANYTVPELGMQAIELLEQGRVEVCLPEQKASGYPYISYGELAKARRVAAFNVTRLHPLVEQGYEVVTIEPTAAYALKQCYPRLLDKSKAARAVADHTHEYFEYLATLAHDGFLLFPPQVKDRRNFGFHIPCHQHGVSGGSQTLHLLRSIGFDVEVIETGTCCGMAGTFGLKAGPLGVELSTMVGKPLFELFEARGIEAIVTESSVCKIQLQEGTGLPVFHPLQLIAESKLV